MAILAPREVGRYELRALVGSLRSETVVLLALAVLGLITHGLNMFQYPSFTGIDDEGIYAAQAWAVLREGQLSPYTYVYDHVPAGWILTALWMGLTGGPHAFGGAIDSGRALMLLMHVASLLMLYRIARKLGCGVAPSALAALLFTVSPLALAYQRRLLLDNIMLFWCLLSLDLLLDGWGRLSRVTLSGVCFGLALLSKETAVFLLPPMLYVAWQQRWQHQGRFAVFGWLVPMAMVVSWYPMYAALKGELLPAGAAVQFSTSGYGNAGVSLIDSLLWQMGRDGGGAFNPDNQFWSLVRAEWLPKDAVLLLGGCLATVLNLARGWRGTTVANRRAAAAGLLGLLPFVFLARGGIVFDFYLLLAIPFLCLNVAVLAAPLLSLLREWIRPMLVTLGVCGALVSFYAANGALAPLYAQVPGTAGRDAIAWIRTHIPADAFIVTRDDLWTDLREPGTGGRGFPNVHSYTKVAGDPAIRGGVFGDDWRTVDYLVVSPALEQTLTESGNTIALQALQHAHRVKGWTTDGSTLEVWKVDKTGATEQALLGASSAYLNHMERDGALASRDGVVTSESQAYALLRAVWAADKDGFDRVWRWSKAHIVNSNGLLARRWNGQIADTHSAADADTDAALALLLAGRRWASSEWLAEGTRMASAIWQHDVARAGDAAYLCAGDWAPELDVVPINPSYFAPYAYHVFQEVDSEHDWLGLVDAGYRLLFDSSAALLGGERSSGLPPDWLGIDRATGRVDPLGVGTDQTSPTSTYGYDAPRTYWRIALDLRWNGDGRAAAYLMQAGFLRDEVNRSGGVRAVYAHDGSVDSADTSVVGSAGALAALLTLDPAAANRLYAGQILGGVEFVGGEAHWNNPLDLYSQEWAWFATAMYADALPDLWHGGR